VIFSTGGEDGCIKVKIGHLKFAKQHVRSDQAMLRGQRARMIDDARGCLQQRRKSSVGLRFDRLEQMEVDARFSASAFVLLCAVASDCSNEGLGLVAQPLDLTCN